VLASSIGCDRATKIAAEASLRGAGRLSFLHDLFRLEYARNTGAFLGLGSSLMEPLRSILFVGGVAVMVVVLLVLSLTRNRTAGQIIALSLVASGGLGNLWDRVFYGGSVTDFMNVGIGSLRTGIFNVADLAVMAGAIFLAFGSRAEAVPAKSP
jgi:signal peptidase II